MLLFMHFFRKNDVQSSIFRFFRQNKLRKIFFIRTNVSKMGYLNKRISGNYKKYVLQHI